jgi:sulfur-oxidizing protein SoxX
MTTWVIRCMLAACFVLAAPLITQAQQADGDVIVESLSGAPGDPLRGRVIVLSRQSGLCILCHSGPFPDERFQGNLAPDLAASAAGLSEAQLRARIVDASRFNPDTIMPSYFKKDGLTRVAPQFAGKTLLTAQEIEDVVAFLVSLKP